MIILVHDARLSDKGCAYFKKFKNLELINKEEANDKIRSFWKQVETVIDTTSNHEFYKKCKGQNEDRKFGEGVNFVEYKGRKIVNLFSLNNYLYKKDNFTEEQFNRIKKERVVIEKTLKSICDVFQNNLQVELEKFNKPINIKEITLNKEDIYFVKELNENEIAGENIISLNDFTLLKELKDILLYKI